MSAEEIIKGFQNYRSHHVGLSGHEVNILRISGGEPFTQPLLVADIAEQFQTKLKQADTFL